ncbi:lysophospholipid acyltransferase LPEAT1-like isoform X2 [Durio zibethinus]|uniref:Lysophospholipid acyltransferase LPEAT1-like isoform X2 n=1 Tax=Durio zibethinus TaxID=66656 RepID=A0A6P6AVS9_DURZI|nr:lysophospholipid acyltransferase LPEAT1-like isoform X2 [Durio zibethinus]XP_022768896.1 lysophospholipid acyltransferase LPEAT1-like isoform X2 [Durio zibethinus]
MESELKELNSKPAKTQQPDPTHYDASSKDDRPLLKSDSSSAENIQELEKKFAAYARNDVYGPMGRGKLPLKEKLFLGIALVTLLPLRIILGMTILVVYYLICRICTLFSAPNQEEEQEDYAHLGGWRRAVIVRSGRFLSRSLLFLVGFYWINETHKEDSANTQENLKTEGTNQSEKQEKPGAIVSNHVSYLDILYHMSSSFPSFVAKRSVGKIPLVGLISKCLGCVYVQRESKSSDFKGVAGVVTDRVLEVHQNKSAPAIMLFPEGTTTNGDFLLPFKTGAFLAKAPVVPVILRYRYQRFSPAWDSISGVRHVVFLLCQFVNHMEVTWLPLYYPSQQEKDDPKLYANNVRRLMASEGNLILSDIGLAEKRIYHAALNGNNSLPSVLHQKDD